MSSSGLGPQDPHPVSVFTSLPSLNPVTFCHPPSPSRRQGPRPTDLNLPELSLRTGLGPARRGQSSSDRALSRRAEGGGHLCSGPAALPPESPGALSYPVLMQVWSKGRAWGDRPASCVEVLPGRGGSPTPTRFSQPPPCKEIQLRQEAGISVHFPPQPGKHPITTEPPSLLSPAGLAPRKEGQGPQRKKRVGRQGRP